MVLAAGGETLWHVNSAAAAQGSSRLRTPTAALVATHEASSAAESVSNATESKSNAAESNAAMLTTPTFKPFVLVRIPLPEDHTSGEVMGLNESGQAVGWMYDDSAEADVPFFFDPAAGVTLLELPTGTDSGHALAINDEDPPIIVGWLHDSTAGLDRAASWESDGDFIEFFFDDETPSAAEGINDDQRIVGVYKDPTDPHSFVIEDTSDWTPAYTTTSGAKAVNTSGKVVGWELVSSVSHAYAWVPDTTTDIHPNPYDSSGANAINDGGYIGGWVEDDGDYLAALWTPMAPGVFTFDSLWSGADAEVTDLNDEGELVIMRSDATPGVAIWTKRGTVNSAEVLDDLTLMHTSSDVITSGRTINDAGWIGGSYKAEGTGDPLPCLVIPYDVDNNGEPDYREILDDGELDVNGNGLLDWAESMRVGLHAPGYSGDNWHLIDAQIVRLSMHLRYLPTESIPDLDSYPLNEVLEGGTMCSDFETAINRWGRGNGTYERQRELIIWLRSSLVDNDLDYDYLPEDPLEVDAEDILEDIHEFAYRFAHCVDYIQTGNEVFGGAGGYKFYPENVPVCASNNQSWTSGAKTFQELGYLDNACQQCTCQSEAVEKVLSWLDDQMWAALEGSALAGRPLRMIGPGIPSGIVEEGYNSASRYRTLMTTLTPWLNERQMYFDMHVHYFEVESNPGSATVVVQKLTDTYSGSSAPWEVPDRLVSLEMGPRANSTWTSAEDGQFDTFHSDRGCSGSPPDCCNVDPGETWEEFVERWRQAQFSAYAEFGVSDVIDEMAAPGGDPSVAFTAVCYGPTIMTPAEAMSYDMACLRANRVCDNTETITFTDDEDKFSDIKGYYETALLSYWIEGFSIHDTDCDGCP